LGYRYLAKCHPFADVSRFHKIAGARYETMITQKSV